MCWVILLNLTPVNAQILDPVKPKDIRVPVAHLILSDSSSVYGHVMALTGRSITLYGSYDNPDDIRFTTYEATEIRRINYHRTGKFSTGFNRGFWPFETLFIVGAIEDWDSGWAGLYLFLGTLVSIPPGILMGIVEAAHHMNKSFDIDQKNELHTNHYMKMKNKVKPAWTGLTLTNRGKTYLEELSNQEIVYQVNYRPTIHITLGTGIYFSNFYRRFLKADDSSLPIENSGTLQRLVTIGVALSPTPKLELGYLFSSGFFQALSYRRFNAEENLSMFWSISQSDHQAYGLYHLQRPNFNKHTVGLSVGAGVNFSEANILSSISYSDRTNPIRLSNDYRNSHEQLTNTSVIGMVRAEYFVFERFSVLAQLSYGSPVKVNFKEVRTNTSPVFSTNDVNMRYSTGQMITGIRWHL